MSRLLVPSTVLALALVLARPAAAQQPRDTLRRTRLSDVLVDAERVERPASRTPASVTAVDATRLEATRTRDAAQLVGLVPGLALETARPGFTRLTLRGVNAGGQFGWRQGAATAMYLGDAPVTTRTNFFFASPDLSLGDLARVEVWRGPQGTLFGSSAIGGAVRFVPARPDASRREQALTTELGATGAAGTPNGALRGMTNLPLADGRAALRVAGELRRDAGFVDAIVSDRQALDAARATGRTLRDVNDATRLALRASLAWRPDDAWTIEPVVQWHGLRAGATGDFRLNVYGDARPATIYGRNRAFEGDGRPYEFLDDDLVVGALTVARRIPAGRLVAVTSLQSRRARQRDDAVAANGNWVEAYGLDSLYDVSLEPTANVFGTTIRQVTQELRAELAPAARWRATLGLYASELRQVDTLQYSLEGTPPALLSRYGLAGPVVFEGRDRFRERELALFADGTLALGGGVELGLGVRATRYRQRLVRFANATGFADTAGTLLTLPADASRLTPRASLAWRPREATMLYGAVSDGFRTGGANPPEIPVAGRCPDRASLPARPDQFGPDRVRNWELGAKQRGAGGRLDAALTAFQLDWTDIQAAVSYTCADNTTINWTGNGPRARTRGVEWEGGVVLRPGLVVRTAATWLDARYVRDDTAAGITARTRLGYVPRWTGALGLDWVGLRTRGWLGTPYAGATWRYQGARPDPNWGPVADPATGRDLPAMAVTGARFGVVRGRWDVALVVDNLFDTRPVLEQLPLFATAGLDLGALRAARVREEVVLRPRTVTLVVRVR